MTASPAVHTKAYRRFAPYPLSATVRSQRGRTRCSPKLEDGSFFQDPATKR